MHAVRLKRELECRPHATVHHTAQRLRSTHVPQTSKAMPTSTADPEDNWSARLEPRVQRLQALKLSRMHAQHAQATNGRSRTHLRKRTRGQLKTTARGTRGGGCRRFRCRENSGHVGATCASGVTGYGKQGADGNVRRDYKSAGSVTTSTPYASTMTRGMDSHAQSKQVDVLTLKCATRTHT